MVNTTPVFRTPDNSNTPVLNVGWTVQNAATGSDQHLLGNAEDGS